MGAFLKKNSRLLIGILVVSIAAVGYFATRSRSGNTSTQFQAAKIEKGNLVATIGATGTVRAKQSATLIWQAAGTVDKVNVKVGDKVEAGDALANLQKGSLPQSVILAEADLLNAQKTLDDLKNSDTARAQALIALQDAQDAYEKAENYRKELNGKVTIREVKFVKVGGLTVPEVREYKGYADANTIADADAKLALAKAKLDDAQRTYDRLKDGPNQTDIAAAQARVEAAQATLNLGRVIAPFDGTITEADPLPGDQIMAGATAFRIDDLTHLFVDVEVSEVDINSVSLGQDVTLSFDAILDKDYHGKVAEVAQAGKTVGGVVDFTVTVELTDADEQVKPGMTAAVNVTVKELKDVLLVPNRAVRVVDGKRVIYLLVNNKQVKTEIRLGSSSDTNSAIVGGNVKEGDTVILNPAVEFQGGPGGGGPRGDFGG